VAEAAKVIENSQRDIIAFVNNWLKYSIWCNWYASRFSSSSQMEFFTFKPGLVGGHCIGVDPYYLAQRARIWIPWDYISRKAIEWYGRICGLSSS
jgi:UDP-N-acetyl-D-galactosamine dehydrogenase